IDPNTSWFFDGISDTAGDKTLERKAFEVASYGRQLGLITEVLIDLAARLPPTSAEAVKSLVRLRDIQNRIEQLKDTDTIEIAQQIDGLLVRLEKKNPDRVAAACKRVDRVLTAPVE
ncbi:MAG: hypothetical protein ACJ79W_05500, partial [Myxococcales bacterium]